MIGSRRRRCFISYSWGDKSIEGVIHNVVSPVLEKAGWEYIDPRNFSFGESIFDLISKAVRNSDLLIVELSRGNSNVLYEMGMAHGWGKKTLLLTQRIEAVPFDVASKYQVLAYSSDFRGHDGVDPFPLTP